MSMDECLDECQALVDEMNRSLDRLLARLDEVAKKQEKSRPRIERIRALTVSLQKELE